MKRNQYLILFSLSLIVALVVSTFQSSPGYMDAEYYFATGLQLARGEGFSEPFLWNYMDAPHGIPHPSHGYWLPMASLLAALGMVLTGNLGFSSAKIGFILFASLIPPLTAGIAYSLTGKRRSGILAGILGVFSVFYLPYLPTSDTFGLYMVLGGLCFLLPSLNRGHLGVNVLYGSIAGLMYLTRADGLIWLFVAIGMTFYSSSNRTGAGQAVQRLTNNNSRLILLGFRFTLVISGFLIIVTPWLLRNQFAFGTPLSPGGSKALWFTDYNQLFAYPSSQISFDRWLASGLMEILRVRLWALGQNVQTAIAVQGSIFLVPFILIGAWQWRRDFRVKLGLAAWLVTLLAMTLAFPFAGARGGFFHSGAALQPLLWALAAVGLDGFVGWGSRVRGWNTRHARQLYATALICFAIVLSVFIFGQRVLGWGGSGQSWDGGFEYHRSLNGALEAFGVSSQDIVMVNNTPGFYLANGLPSIVIPDGDESTLLSAAENYGATYVILESNHPQGLNDLYESPDKHPHLQLLWSDENSHIFAINSQP